MSDQSDKKYDERVGRIKEITSSDEVDAGKYYDLDILLSKWSTKISGLKKYNVYVTESEMQS